MTGWMNGNYEYYCMDELMGNDKTSQRWLDGCSFEDGCNCIYCRGNDYYFNKVGFIDRIVGSK